MRISSFEHDVARARKRETLILDQYFRFGVQSVEVTAPSLLSGASPSRGITPEHTCVATCSEQENRVELTIFYS